jgi:Cyclin D1 binding domain/F-box-like
MGVWLIQRPKPGTSSPEHEKPKSVTSAPKNIDNVALLQLPPEIFQHILSNLECQSLVSLSRTCRTLRHHAQNDMLWARLLRRNIPPSDFPDTPYPSNSYRELYISHHPYWFLSKYKIWFSDDPHTGRIMLVKFDPRRGCIEGYRLLADRGQHHFQQWPAKPGVIIYGFAPRVHLWLDDPILKLNPDLATFNTKQGWWEGEMKMKVGRAGHNTSASFFLARAIPEMLLDKSMVLWPPITIPNMPRVRAISQDKFRGYGHKPQKYEEISQTTFRMRQWSQFSIETTLFGVRMGEEVSTWSTIDPILYTPTEKRPYQGIFVGDYAGHGCEFLLVTQTDKAPKQPEPNGISEYVLNLTPIALESLVEASRSINRPTINGNVTVEEDNIYQGAIEAIKLTGDPNVPRGEHTFIADDISAAGLIRIADELPFRGARIVRSRGHCAGRGFQSGKSMKQATPLWS